jgi:hypothetical protein
MSSIKTSIVQSTLNSTVEITLPTGLTVDGKAGWNIQGVRFLWANAAQCVTPVADCMLFIQLNTETGNQQFTDKDNIIYGIMASSGIAASTSSFWVDGNYQQVLPVPRLTVQPALFLNVSSIGLIINASIYAEVFYDVVKLTDLEVMRLSQGGA